MNIHDERVNVCVVNCVFVTFPCGILGQVWYSIVLIPDLCCLSYFNEHVPNHDYMFQ